MAANDPWYWSTDSSEITDTRTEAAKRRLAQVTTGDKQVAPPTMIEPPKRGQTIGEWGIGYSGGMRQKAMDLMNQQNALWDDPQWAANQEQQDSQAWREGKTFQWDNPMPTVGPPADLGGKMSPQLPWSEQQPKKKTNTKPTNTWSGNNF